MSHQIKWAYGLTTVKERFNTTLPKTLASLERAGFPEPRLFVDGPEGIAYLGPLTSRSPRIGPYGNWILGLWELWARDPGAERYAMFQDDFVTYPNLRKYLDCYTYDDTSRFYWNLYTFPHNQAIANVGEKEGWFKAIVHQRTGNQMGLGAVALVFSNKAVRTLLSHQHMVDRLMDMTPVGGRRLPRGQVKIDGGVVSALSEKSGFIEMVHNPSLVQHIGEHSSMGNGPHPCAESFRGENFDAERLCHLAPKSIQL